MGGGHRRRLPADGRIPTSLCKQPGGTQRVLGSPAGKGVRKVRAVSDLTYKKRTQCKHHASVKKLFKKITYAN